jgi:hypothetical protein
MKIKIEYPINGVDLDLFISGEVIGKSREDHDLFLYDVIARLGKSEVFRFDGDEHGLLKETELSEEIRQISETLLVEEKFRKHEQV